MSAKTAFLNGFYGVFEKLAEDEEKEEKGEEKGEEKKPFSFPPKKKGKGEDEEKEKKKEEKKEKKDDDDGEEKEAAIFMDGFFDFFEKGAAAAPENPLDVALAKLGAKAEVLTGKDWEERKKKMKYRGIGPEKLGLGYYKDKKKKDKKK